MSAHASPAFSIAHCTDSEDLPIIVMTEVTHMRPLMHNTLVLRNLREYRNKYSATESVGVSATMHFYVMRRETYGIR